MPKYKYEVKFKCDSCNKSSIKKGTCRPKACSNCGADKTLLKLISQSLIVQD